MKQTAIQTLLVEDDSDLAASIADFLALKDIYVDHAFNGESGFNLATSNSYDVLLLDLMLPRVDGLTLCEKLRAESIDTPILMLTARDTLDDKLAGFSAGTDDYLVKPFALQELVVRIQALSKRRSNQARKLNVSDLTLDIASGTVSRSGEQIKLTPSGWTILETLMRASPDVVSRRQLETALWHDEAPNTDALKVHMYHLRQQIDKPFKESLINTIPNQGFAIYSQKHSAQDDQ